MSTLLRYAFMLLFCFAWSSSHAHKQSDSYLTLTVNDRSLEGRWDIALRDLDIAVGLDANADGQITWGEVRTQRAAIERYAFDRLRIESSNAGASQVCATSSQNLLVDEHVDGAYAVLLFAGACTLAPQKLSIDYRLLFPIDPNHHGLLQLRSSGMTQTAVLTREQHLSQLEPRTRNGWQEFRAYVREGIWHIWNGYDHLLFLFTLLLPAVVIYREGTWQARSSWRESATDILRVITAFTAAHSITLTLAALGLVNLPSRFVESAIAATVLLGALNILYPLVKERRWLVALFFGLIHGLGFASVLGDLGLPSRNLLQALLGFNAGVELGQLAIVALLMPITFWIRETLFYRRLLLPAGASCVCILAAYWIVTRALVLP
ncbi:MAG: HupE/UreJ family protein [Povalibacter sp.]